MNHIDNTPATPLNDAQQAGFLLAKIPFQKRAYTTDQQIEHLQERGMVFDDLDLAASKLREIGYYRLSGYWFPFQKRDGSETKGHFREPLKFSDVMDLYALDRELRHITSEQIEFVEVQLRANISDSMALASGGNPHWYIEPSKFQNHINHSRFLADLGNKLNIKRKAPEYLKHYNEKYESPQYPPCWMVFENLSLGDVSHLYANLLPEHQKLIADQYGLPRDRLQSWLHALTYIRNICAHHARLWNRIMSVSPTISKTLTKEEFAELPHERKYYSHAVMIQALLNSIGVHWGLPRKLERLFMSREDIHHMGFPEKWRDHSVWR